MGQRPSTDQQAEGISELARELSGETESGRRLAGPLVDRLRETGLLSALAPAEVGGLELAPGPALRCAEEIARGDGSAGWCVSIGMTSSLLAAYLPDTSRAELFADDQTVAAGVWAPQGTARPVRGGLAVSGRWAFCSGIDHADLLFAGCRMDGDPRPRVVALRRAEVEILDTWHTLGLRGTGSHDAAADAVLVPADRVFSLFDGPIVDRPLYRFPVFGFFAQSIAAAALGIARGAIDELVKLAATKVGPGSGRALAERAPTQAAVARAEAALGAARALCHEAIATAWQTATSAEPSTLEPRRRLRLAATHAVRTSADVVRAMYDLGGGRVVYDDAPLQRRFRDAHTATAHFQVGLSSYELPGRIRLGLPGDTSTL